MSFTKNFFDYTEDKKEVYSLILKNKSGMTAEILTFGGTLKSLIVPDKKGGVRDVILGHKNLSEYEKSTYIGATIGRYANRIAKGKFTLDGAEYTLAKNNGENHLHGGLKGYNLALWEIKEFIDSDEPSVTLFYNDPDMFEGYPGNVKAEVTFGLKSDNSLFINYKATTDKKTVINLTNHSYFNLNGYDSGTATDQLVKINAGAYTPIDSTLIPTGEIKAVEGTPFDFRNYKKIEQDINADDNDLKFAGGYDHNFVLNTKDLSEEAISAYSIDSGIKMSVFTDMPGVQFYTANFLDGTNIGKDEKHLEFRTGYCFETQFFPDSPNKPDFPSCILTPDRLYDKTTIFKFDII